MYAVMAIIGRKIPDGSWPLRQVPTFYLDESVQGIVSAEHAEQIAREVIDPFRQYEVHVTVALVDPATPTQDGQAMPLGGSRKTTSSNSLIPSVDPTIEVPATIRRARETLQRLSMREANGDERK